MSNITKEVMDAIVEASAGSLFVRALLENQADIINAGKFKLEDLNKIIDKTMVNETEKYRILLFLSSKGQASVSEMKSDLSLSELSIMKQVLALENEGWVELRNKDNLIYGVKPIIKKTNGDLDIDLTSPWNLRSTYDPISVVTKAHLCVLCGACKAVCPV